MSYVDCGVDPFVVSDPQLPVVGCLAIVGVVFASCGVLRLQEVYLLGGCDAREN